MESSSKIIFLFLLGSLILFSKVVQAQTQTTFSIPWGYTGNIAPERWGQLDPSFAMCVEGKLQSPIDIPNQVLPSKKNLTFTYHPTIFSIARGENAPYVKFPADPDNFLIFNGQKYKLIAMHIHAPSEHLWHGRDFPLEIHLVHQNERNNLDPAPSRGMGLLFVAIFARGGEENLELTKILANLNPSEKRREVRTIPLDLNEVLPKLRSYYNFMGSLTTPPCTEGVQWIVFANPITVSPAQIVRFKTAIGGVNARPTQPLNGRKIFYSTQRKLRYNYAAL